MTNIERRTLGDSNLKVSKICLGSMTWGEQNTEVEAHQQMDYALARDINFFDTAEMYPVPPKGETQGLTETYMGTWFKKSGRRADIVLATKVTGPGDWMTHIRQGPQLTRAHIRAAIEGSLKRLQTDYVDLYQLHWPSRATNFFGKLGYEYSDKESTPLLESLLALDELVQEGKIRHYGLSNETAWGAMTVLRLAETHGLQRPLTIQNPYNLLNRSYEVGLAEVSQHEHVGLLAYSPMAFGVLSGKFLNGQRPPQARITRWERFARYNGEHAEVAVQKYADLALEFGLTPAQMALAFVTQQPFTTATIIGATTIEQLQENIGTADLVLSEELLARINAIHKVHSNPCP